MRGTPARRKVRPGETMQVILDVVHGPRKGASFVFDRHDTFIVGRSPSVHCAMPEDSALSRDHFLIEVNPPRCELRDLGSTNGTFVNDERVDRVAAPGRATGSRPGRASSSSGSRGRRSRSTESSGAKTATIARRRRRPRRPAAPAAASQAPPGAARRRGSRTTASVALRPLPGRVATTPQPVPNYTVLRELGRGAMGVVYQARHNQTGRMVALKLIVPESAATRTAIDRFLREMSVISQLKHPNIVEWLEQGMTRGQFWFTMEYVEGTNLEAVANAEPRPATRSTRPAGWPARSSRGWPTPTRSGSSTATSSPRTS